MQMVNLKPVGGLLVRLEVGEGFLPAKGKEVPLTTYYRRRLADGDVEHVPSESDEAAETNADAAEPAVETDHTEEVTNHAG